MISLSFFYYGRGSRDGALSVELFFSYYSHGQVEPSNNFGSCDSKRMSFFCGVWKFSKILRFLILRPMSSISLRPQSRSKVMLCLRSKIMPFGLFSLFTSVLRWAAAPEPNLCAVTSNLPLPRIKTMLGSGVSSLVLCVWLNLQSTICMTSEADKLAVVQQLVKKDLELPQESEEVNGHIAGILLEESPINSAELFEMIADFLGMYRVERKVWTARCDLLFSSLKSAGVLSLQNKFSLSADRLEKAIILENVLSMDEAKQPLFAKKPTTAGNSNDQMSKWRKKEKGVDREDAKAILNLQKHMIEIENRKKELPPVQIRREKIGTGKNFDLILENITLVIAGKTLLDATNLKLAYGRKYGLVGRNGIGKTCLMNALARGQFPKMPKHLQILLVEQELRDTSKTVMNTVLETDIEREELLAEQEELSTKDGSMVRMNQIFKRLEQIEANKAESRAAAILGGLGFTTDMLHKAVGSLSGGWRVRVALARALFVEPEVLLLDEPTNHLDLDAVMWLQDYICNCKSTVVIVSHAREFLNVTCNEIVHYCNEKLDYYKGNYDTFEKLRIQNRERNRRQVENQQMKLEHMQAFIDKFRFNAKRASLVQSRIKSINKMELVEEVIEDPSCVFIFPTPDKLRPPLLRLEDGYFTYQEEKYILRNVNFALDMESRIAIVGANGVGKSTLLKLLVGSLDLSSGNSYRNGRLSLSMFTQHHIDQLKLHLSPLEQFMVDFPGSTQQTYRSHLGSFGVTGTLALRPNYLLSGGQKSRVAFSLAMWKNPHILVLDEPTNHLDIDAVNALIIALNNYQGGVVIVSHDQHLISTVCDQIWYLKDTRLKKFTGDFEDYRRQLSQGKL